jgi:uncharacterized protein GlcG (DUF336 family)
MSQTDPESAELTLEEARAMIDRALAKAAELNQAGAFAVVDAGGNVVSISRMDGSPAQSVHVARAKAYGAAVNGRPTAMVASRWQERPTVFGSLQTLLPGKLFPGPGGMTIRKGRRIVGGIATAGVPPTRQIPGVDPAKLLAPNGEAANAEDLVISIALGAPYTDQHPGIDAAG